MVDEVTDYHGWIVFPSMTVPVMHLRGHITVGIGNGSCFYSFVWAFGFCGYCFDCKRSRSFVCVCVCVCVMEDTVWSGSSPLFSPGRCRRTFLFLLGDTLQQPFGHDVDYDIMRKTVMLVSSSAIVILIHNVSTLRTWKVATGVGLQLYYHYTQ